MADTHEPTHAGPDNHPAPTTHRHGGGYWARIALVNALAGLAAFGLLGGLVRESPWSERWPHLFASFVYANCIGGTMGLVMPLALHRFSTSGRAIIWAVRLALMPVTIVIGCGVAGGVGMALGFVRPAEYVAQLRGSLWISLLIATVAGLAVVGYETLRGQLDTATEALRTKEREEERARHAATEAQLASLEARVNPHFLFNTLNSIASLTHSDPSGAERMTNQLASLMRSSLEAGTTPLVTLNEELKLVRDYLEIERVRFGPRLHFSIECDHDAGQVRLPRLSVQTLAENAVKYAVASRREGGSIGVRASTSGSLAHVQVEDDGPGFDATQVSDGYGLALLRSRLEFTFGARARLDIHSQPGRTCVAIEVPHEGA